MHQPKRRNKQIQQTNKSLGWQTQRKGRRDQGQRPEHQGTQED